MSAIGLWLYMAVVYPGLFVFWFLRVGFRGAAPSIVAAVALEAAAQSRPALTASATSAPAVATSRPAAVELRALANLSDAALSRPAERYRGLIVTDALADAGSAPAAYAELADKLDAEGCFWGNYISGGYARPAAAFLKTPPEAVALEALPAAYFFPRDEFEERTKRNRLDVTQPAAREAFAVEVARMAAGRRCACIMLDNVVHPDAEGSSAPVSAATNRKPVWADTCALLASIRAKIPRGTLLWPNVAAPAGLWPDSDVAPFIAATDGVLFETPWLHSVYIPRSADSGAKIIRQLRRFSDAGDAVFLIPWVNATDPAALIAQREAEARFIAAFAMLVRRDAAAPVYVTGDTQRDNPDWADWPARLGAPLRDAEIVDISPVGTAAVTSAASQPAAAPVPGGRRYLQREFANGFILIDPTAARPDGGQLPGVATVQIR